MSRIGIVRICRIVAAAAAALLLAYAFSVQPAQLPAVAVFALLVAATAFLRIEAGESSVSFEAPVAFGAIVIFHEPMLAFAAVFAGLLIPAVYRTARKKAAAVVEAGDAALLSFAYLVVALLYSSAVAKSAPPVAKISGYSLLLLGFGATHVILVWLLRPAEDDPAPIDFRRVLMGQGVALLLLSPMVALEVLLHASYGLAGVALALVPVVLVAYEMRGRAELAILNADLLRRNRDLSLLTENSTQILSAEDDLETLRRLMEMLSKLARLKACAVVTWEANPDVPATVYRFGECLKTDQDILRWVDAAGFAQSAPNRAFVFQDQLRRFPLSSGSATQVLIGIQTPEVIYGILIFETDDLSILKVGSLNLLTLLVNQTALALQDQLLRREMREKTAQLEAQAATTSTILSVANNLIGSFDVDGALTTIAQAVRKALGFEIVVFGLLDQKRGDYVRRAHAGLDDVWEEMRRKRLPASEIEEFFNAEFILSNSYYISHASLRQAEHDFVLVAEEHPVRSDEWHENDMLIVPLSSAGQAIGYLSVRGHADRRVPSLEKVQTLEIFAAQAVTALQSARNVEEIKRLTHIDALTPAYNHRFFQEALAREIHRHARSGNEFSLAMLDIDNFKKVNDTFGHPTGDEILKGLVEELMTNARDTDIIARYGGEEFAIILPETAIRTAREAANRFRDLVERRDFTLPQFGRTLHVTVSIGVAVYPRDGAASADLVARADEALYDAKKRGKNCVVLAADLRDAAVS